jgi:electron transport complex protein RnfC
LLRVRIGTTIRSLMEQCGGCDRALGKIIVNGVVTGDCVESLDTIITKDVKSVSFVPKSELSDQERNPCIRCGKCRSICPEGIFPDLIYRHCNGGKKIGREMLSTTALCSGCCLCNSVCPSRLPLCQTIDNLRNAENEI